MNDLADSQRLIPYTSLIQSQYIEDQITLVEV